MVSVFGPAIRSDGRQDDERAVVGNVEVQPAGRNPRDDRPAAVTTAEDEVAGRLAWKRKALRDRINREASVCVGEGGFHKRRPYGKKGGGVAQKIGETTITP